MIATAKRYLSKILPGSLINALRSNTNKKELERRNKIMSELVNNIDTEQYRPYKDEINFLEKRGYLTPFAYPKTDVAFDEVEGEFDSVRKMPYVIHKGKKLYFHSGYTLKRAKKAYTNFVTVENILGGGYLKKAPHQYLTKDFVVKEGDVLIDVGAAEGLFLLDNIDKIKMGYVFEAKALWIEALKATFEPYSDKVQVIHKYATNTNSDTEMTIDACLNGESSNTFIKIDVEGYEMRVLDGCKDVLNSDADVRVACCTYHKNDDAQTIESFFKNLKFGTQFSDGYVLFFYDKEIKPPYFRKGLLRAWNKV